MDGVDVDGDVGTHGDCDGGDDDGDDDGGNIDDETTAVLTMLTCFAPSGATDKTTDTNMFLTMCDGTCQMAKS